MVSHILDDLEGLIKKILAHTGWDQEKLNEKIQKKQDEYGGLLTEAGAAYSIAKEAGVSLEDKAETEAESKKDIKPEKKEIKLKEINKDMNDIDFYARVERAYPVHEFQKENRKGKVASVMIADETSTVRLVLWGHHAELSDSLRPNDLIKIAGGYVKENNDQLEVHLGWRGKLIPEKDFEKKPVFEIPEIPKIDMERKTLKELKAGDSSIQIKADIVNIYPPTLIELCPKCRGMLRDKLCEKCGALGPNEELIYSLILNVELDDGTDVMRGVFYRDLAEKLLDLNAEGYKKDKGLFGSKKKNILGKEMLFYGQIKYVSDFDRLEFIVRNFNEIDVERELKIIQEKSRV